MSEQEPLQETAIPEPESQPSPVERWLATEDGRPKFYLARWVFLRLLALVYGAAFLSFWVQAEGLIGHNGLLPADAFTQIAREHLGPRVYALAPSLFWLYPHDPMLHVLCGGGVLLSLLLLLNLAPTLCLALLWLCYLSLVTISQDFLSFQWDSLLLEVGFISIFFAPLGWRPRLAKQAAPSLVVLLLLWWILFRLMFGSGVVKLGDETWTSLTAVAYHYGTQPLPTPLAWYLYQMPLWIQELSTALVLLVELAAPLLIFTPRRVRIVAAALLILLQLVIIATGNFAFFNWLSIALCLLLLDDRHYRRLIPKRLHDRFRCPESNPAQRRWKRTGAAVLAATMLLLSLLQFTRLAYKRDELPKGISAVVTALEPFRLVNPYGLFAVMTTSRPEIVIEGSNDGETWLPYEFKHKPVDLAKAPSWIAPHQPRLDWQMWFAAMGPSYMAPWFQNLMVRLLQGQPEVLALLGKNPFPDAPPRYARATLYYYNFTTYTDQGAPKDWWTREPVGPYFEQIALR